MCMCMTPRCAEEKKGEVVRGGGGCLYHIHIPILLLRLSYPYFSCFVVVLRGAETGVVVGGGGGL